MAWLLSILRALPALAKIGDLISKAFDQYREARAAKREQTKIEATDRLIDDLAAGRVPVDPAGDKGRVEASSPRPRNSGNGSATS